MFIRDSTMAPAGIVLSQPTSTTSASTQWPRAASSMESAMTSRLTSEARMPSVPIATPSETEMVLISIGMPPAVRTPALTCSAISRWLKLHGIVSIHWCATPTIGRRKSSSVKPIDLSIERAGARAGPSVMAALLGRGSGGMAGPSKSQEKGRGRRAATGGALGRAITNDICRGAVG